MFTASIHVITPFLSRSSLRRREGLHAGLAGRRGTPARLSTAPNVPANNLKEFFDLVRKSPDKFTFATSSFGSAGHLAIELLKRDAGRRYAGDRLQGRRADAQRHHGRADPAHRRPDGVFAAAGAGREDQGAGVYQPEAGGGRARIPTVEESGPSSTSSWYGLWGPKGHARRHRGPGPSAAPSRCWRGPRSRKGSACSVRVRSAPRRRSSPSSSTRSWRTIRRSSATRRSRRNERHQLATSPAFLRATAISPRDRPCHQSAVVL